MFMPEATKQPAINFWLTMPLEEMFERLQSSRQGLSDAQAIARSEKFGLNELVKKKRTSPFIKFLSYFRDPLSLVLLFAAAISGLTGDVKSTAVIISMVILSAALNFYQEHKSNRAAEKIAKRLTVRSSVWRDGEAKEILTRYLVPGDLVVLAAGDIVPGDCRLIQSDDFFVNESALTGESFPVEKHTGGEGDRGQLIFSGTNVVSGSATGLVYATGAATEFGKIADRLNVPEERNSFEVGIQGFGYLIIKVIIGIVLLIFFINALNHKDLLSSLVFSIAVAVGITPELLPLILSINMSRGSINMSKKGVIVKRLNAIPDFGSMDILCTDKTGTLTEDRITLIKHLDLSGKSSESVLRLAYINGYFETGIKSLLDQAILQFKDMEITEEKKIDEIPYDFARKRSSVVIEAQGQRRLVTKGAPEEVFKICSYGQTDGRRKKLTGAELGKYNHLYEELSRQGFRVLAIASKDLPTVKYYTKQDETEMTLSGFLAFFDPPKQSAKETLDFMAKHGIEVKILTGDSALVTKKICDDLGIPIKGIVTGDQIDVNTMNEEAIAVIARNSSILARMSPSQKHKIITALRSKGSVVGYLGDGINDAPSLKAADVGISVENAVDIAKETADIILVRKGLQELMDGVLEGRRAFINTMKYMMMGLSSNFGNMFSMVGAALYLPFFPMLPGQILLNNLLYDVSQVTIPADNVDAEYLNKPKHWDLKFVRNFMFFLGPVSSLFDFLTFYALYGIFQLSAPLFHTGWFIESLATQTLVIYVIRTRKLPFIESRPGRYLVYSSIGVLAAAHLLIFTPIGKIFGFEPLPGRVLLAIWILVLIYLFLVEIVKRIFYRVYYKSYPHITTY